MGRIRTKNRHWPPRFTFKSGRYWYVERGSQKWIAIDADNEYDAIEKWRTMEARYRRAENGTIAAAIDRYLDEILPTLRPETQRQYKRLAIYLRELFGHLALTDLRPVHIATLLDKTNAKVSGNRMRSVLSTIYSYAIRWGMCDNNPVREIRRNTEHRRRRYVEDWEFAAVREIASPFMRCAMDFAYITGMRQGDQLSLRLSDIKSQEIKITDQKTGQPGDYRITQRLDQIIEQAKSLRHPIGSLYLFCTARGQPYTSDGFRAIWRKLMQRALKTGAIKDGFTWHDLRAKHATDGKAKGLNVQITLGHRSPATTAGYIRSRERDKREPLE